MFDIGNNIIYNINTLNIIIIIISVLHENNHTLGLNFKISASH